ncbi:hypothetical protein PIB30_075847 [Stylosanthes scabra]|uniref:Uncharacterized protein n=1 Tax=Stylosanthes scabra TaxID=79078 RepID=A0ABU6RQE6_9FABA|nr:hypothetical protein [Stylosanthes scabra]
MQSTASILRLSTLMTTSMIATSERYMKSAMSMLFIFATVLICGREPALMTLNLYHLEIQVTDQPRRGREALLEKRAEIQHIYQEWDMFRGVQIVVLEATNGEAARSYDKLRVSSSNAKGKVTNKSENGGTGKSLSQPLPQITNKNRKAAIGTSSSQPLPPPRAASNTYPNPKCLGRGRRATATTSASNETASQSKKISQNRASTKTSNRPNATSASKPSKRSTKEITQPTSRCQIV